MRLLAALLLLLACACRGPEAAPAPAAGPRLVVHFLDKDAVLPLSRGPQEGAWAFMNMGLWEGLDIRWREDKGDCAVGRTAPDWLLMRDPEGEIHRLVLRGPGPDELQDRDENRMDPEDRDFVILVGLAWVWAWSR